MTSLSTSRRKQGRERNTLRKNNRKIRACRQTYGDLCSQTERQAIDARVNIFIYMQREREEGEREGGEGEREKGRGRESDRARERARER